MIQKINQDYDLSEMMQTTLQESSLIQAGLATFAKRVQPINWYPRAETEQRTG